MIRHRPVSLFLSAALMLPAAAAAQTFTPSPNPVTDVARAQLARFSKYLIASADLLPADKYGFQPTPAQMTFGQLLAHIVHTNIALCHGASGMPAPMSPQEMKAVSAADGKDALAAAIRKSFDYCEQALAKLQDAGLGEEASIFNQRTGMSRAAALMTIVVDWADHYSTAASYLRLNGLLPPSATPKR
jgi:uncharacterized damage-inducible protein DinB